MIIGITGIIGSGKSIAAKYISRKYNYVLIDVDQVGHQLLEKDSEIYDQIITEFETNNRKKIAKIVFSDQEKLSKLNQIMHPVMFVKIKEQIKKFKLQNINNIIIEAALLFQMGLDVFCKQVILIKSDEKIISERLKQKGLSQKEINERLANAPCIDENEVKIVENNGFPEELQLKLDKLLAK